MVAPSPGTVGGIRRGPSVPAKDLLISAAAVKRSSREFWAGNRLTDLLEVIAARAFAPADRLTPSDLARDARQSAACGHELVIHRPVPDVSTGEVRAPYIHRGYYCQMPAVCPVCSRRVGDVRQARYAPHLAAAIDEGLHPYLLTFTLPSGPVLRDQLAQLRAALRVFQTRWRLPSCPRRRAAALRRGRQAGEWQKVRAAGLKIEVKRGEGSGEWHVHAHALVFTRSRLDYRLTREVVFRGRPVRASKLSAEWLEATGGAAMGIDAHPLYRDRKTGRRLTRDGMVSAAREIMKYTSILDDRSTSDDWVDVRVGTWGRRLWSVYGAFRGLGDDDYVEDPDDVGMVDEVRVSWRGEIDGEYHERGDARRVSPADRRLLRVKSLTLRARVNGIVRKMRTAIFRARQEWERVGVLPAAFDVEVIPASGGDRVSMQWPAPSYLTPATAADGSGWERWTDEVTTAARSMVASAEQDVQDMELDDVLAYRWAADAHVSDETWEAWRRMLEIRQSWRRRQEARDAVMFGGLQQDAFTPDFFGAAESWCEAVGVPYGGAPPGWWDPPDGPS